MCNKSVPYCPDVELPAQVSPPLTQTLSQVPLQILLLTFGLAANMFHNYTDYLTGDSGRKSSSVQVCPPTPRFHLSSDVGGQRAGLVEGWRGGATGRIITDT